MDFFKLFPLVCAWGCVFGFLYGQGSNDTEAKMSSSFFKRSLSKASFISDHF